MITEPGTISRLNSQMLRRSPSRNDLARRTPIVLTDRDKEILAAIHMHGFLTTELIELAFFPQPENGRRSPSSRAYERVQHLWRWSLIERLERPMARSLGGRRPYLYTLSRQGAIAVAPWISEETVPIQARRLDRLSDVFVDHDLYIAAFWACLVLVLRSTKAELRRWQSERSIRARRMRVWDPKAQRWLPVLPDGEFEVLYPDGFVQTCLLEVDMGTLTLARFRRKLRAFELERDLAATPRQWSEDFEVFILTHSRSRLQHLWRATRDEVPPERWRNYSFATFDVLDPGTFSEYDWVDGENRLVPVLYNDVPADPSAAAGGSPQ